MNINKLKELRIEKDLNQKEIAQIIGLDNTLYNKYENDYNTIPLVHLIALCDYFDVSLDYIFDLSENKKYPNYIQGVDKNKAGKRLKMWRKENKITQEKLALLFNTNRSVIANYESGRFLISTLFLDVICKKYKVSADYLVGKID